MSDEIKIVSFEKIKQANEEKLDKRAAEIGQEIIDRAMGANWSKQELVNFLNLHLIKIEQQQSKERVGTILNFKK